MQLQFPDSFVFGTSTAAAQIETAYKHDWLGVTAKDGYVFTKTCEHEKQFDTDADIIAYCAPNYRMSLQWSRLQPEPYADLDAVEVQKYKDFIGILKQRNVNIMMVLHHFCNPLWFTQNGHWHKEENISMWVDYAKKVVDTFGEHVTYWNTFNEPNVYVSNGWVMGQFPPFKKNPLQAFAVIKNLGKAHGVMYDYIKSKFPEQPVGISHNTVIFAGRNPLGKIPAAISDWWFMEHCLKQFDQKLDFFGLSYYAKIQHDPFPVTYIDTPEKIKKYNLPHDGMWEYYPKGMQECIERYWAKYKLPFIITESGVCAPDDAFRIKAMKDYVKIIYDCMQKGIDIKGYYWWSTFDNFEWNLGPTYRFGLYETNPDTLVRTKRPSAEVYHNLAYQKSIEV